MWSAVFRRQDWSTVLAALLLIIPVAVLDSTTDFKLRSFSVYDATISFRYNAASTIPYWVAVVGPGCCMLLSFAAGELGMARGLHASAISAAAAVLHFSLDGIASFLVTSVVTSATKITVGRYRPDWLDRCRPDLPSDITLAYGASPADNIACSGSTLSASKMRDGHWSFPSGHASTVFAFAIYSATYCMWTLYFRPARQYAGGLLGLRQQVIRDAVASCGLLWILAQLLFAW
jgi:membrane-associated phospholipid phosphatase